MGSIQAIALDASGKTLISRDSNQSVLFWNLRTYRSDRSVGVARAIAVLELDHNHEIGLTVVKVKQHGAGEKVAVRYLHT
ncbi:hypothetical protein [Leptolyngbya sp. BC1307]|uniref:hypothetical protein n=1 Tax=Leptolyngbya sp. BC1307 TaxID=2029589 RepID=UPI000EFAA8D9|nr:hypothetical protein [Leptolyngbya sp. BC1307]